MPLKFFSGGTWAVARVIAGAALLDTAGLPPGTRRVRAVAACTQLHLCPHAASEGSAASSVTRPLQATELQAMASEQSTMCSQERCELE